jgi:hypothetical protein
MVVARLNQRLRITWTACSTGYPADMQRRR